MFGNVSWNPGLGSPQQYAAEGQSGDVFEHVGILDSGHGGLAPGKGRVAGDENPRNGEGVKVFPAKAADDDRSGVAHVGFGDFFGG